MIRYVVMLCTLLASTMTYGVGMSMSMSMPMSTSTGTSMSVSMSVSDTLHIEELINSSMENWYTNPDEALKFAEQALELSTELGFDSGKARALRSLGVINDIKGDYDQALNWYQQSLEIAESVGLLEVVGAVLNNIGLAYWNKGQPQQATEYYLRALKILDVTGPPQRLASVYNNLGLIFYDTKRLQESFDYHQRALDIRLDLSDMHGIGASYHNMGLVRESQGDNDAALDLYRQSVQIKREIRDLYGLGITLNNIGSVYIKLEEWEKALPYFQESASIRESIGDRNGLATAYNNISIVYREMGDYENSIKLAYQVLETARASGFLVREYRVYGNLSENYAAIGDYRQAYKYVQEFYTIRDSINNLERSRQIADIVEAYESEKKQQQIELQDQLLIEQNLLIERNRVALIALVIVVLLMITTGFLWQNRIKRRELEYRVGQLEIEQQLQRERDRISRDLHDHMGAQLVNIISGVDLAQKYGSTNVLEKSLVTLQSVKLEAQSTLSQLRDTIWTLKSNEIKHDEFTAYIDKYLNQVESVSEIRITRAYDVLPDFIWTPVQAMNSYRILQEALQNTLKYAQATNIHITMSLNSGRFEIKIRDNGTFKQHSADPIMSGGSGIQNMEKRALELNGSLSITTDDGTTVKLEFPVD